MRATECSLSHRSDIVYELSDVSALSEAIIRHLSFSLSILVSADEPLIIYTRTIEQGVAFCRSSTMIVLFSHR